MSDMTPREAIKMAESQNGISPLERQKILALALPRLHPPLTWIEYPVVWGFSQSLAKLSRHEIPDYDSDFVTAINQEPSAFIDYK